MLRFHFILSLVFVLALHSLMFLGSRKESRKFPIRAEFLTNNNLIKHNDKKITKTASSKKLKKIIQSSVEKSNVSPNKEIFKRAELLYEIKKNYPYESLINEEEGTVILTLNINTQGKVTKAVIKKSSGYENLDKEAIKSAKNVIFKPALKSNQPMPDILDITLNFILK